MVVIIDYGMGNLRSVQKALMRSGVEARISSSVTDLESATKLILPGVGHFKNGMEQLHKLGMVALLNKKVITDKIPILGICLGMQLFTKHSEEGNTEGLGWINAATKKFQFPGDQKFKIPHMGWNNLMVKKDHPIYDGITTEDLFYFVHSYFVNCTDKEDILSTTGYGIEFVSSFERNNIIGMQFHPEKSHAAGLRILRNFCGEF